MSQRKELLFIWIVSIRYLVCVCVCGVFDIQVICFRSEVIVVTMPFHVAPKPLELAYEKCLERFIHEA